MYSAEELAELADMETEVVEESFEAADRLINTKSIDGEKHEDEFRSEDTEIPDVDDLFPNLDNHD